MRKIECSDRTDFIVRPISSEKKETLKNLVSTKPCSEEILRFITTLENQPDVDLTIFYNNLESLRLLKNDPYFLKYKQNYKKRYNKTVTAFYSIMDYAIYYGESSRTRDLYHELLHAATSLINYDRDIVLCGFDQVSRNNRIKLGNPLNEGYTELLCERFFPTEDFNIMYPTEKAISKIVEEVVGQSVMQRSYFNANLDNLIEALTQYDSEENVLKFLSNYKILKNGKLNKPINYFLLYVYTQHLLEKNKNISSDDLVIHLAEYFHTFGISCLDDVCQDMLGFIITDKIIDRFEEETVDKTFKKI